MPPFLCHDTSMKNTHLEHPEDSVLLGKKSVQQVINFLRERNSTVSTKYDGAPAIVFGTCPETGKKFVGTKSVFNKVKVKVNYTHADIEKNHSNNEKVASILHTCLETLPWVEGVHQCDFIGFGGKNTFTPNTITYDFVSEDVLRASIVVVHHTSYSGRSFRKLEANFVDSSMGNLLNTNSSVHFVNPDAQFTSRRRRIDYILGLASVVCNFVRYPVDKKEQERLMIAINKCIRENRPVDAISGNMLLLFNLITQAKELIMEGISATGDQVNTEIAGHSVNHEGFVVSNQFGVYKLIKRQEFSFYNFTLPKQW